VNQLGKYVKMKPETVDLFVDYLSDRNRSVRQSAIWALSKYGNKSHFSALDELAAWDPIVSRHVRMAKKYMLKPKKTKKSALDKELDELHQKLDDIRKIIK
ncbi:MAG: HEAT repeat domain-containing protein, partial [Candidatus Neomarinimicrobiota bacterium]|nr:HEAT repeat domain-containing protein [Candidatus Neomarinimicrobiota bacterium]